MHVTPTCIFTIWHKKNCFDMNFNIYYKAKNMYNSYFN